MDVAKIVTVDVTENGPIKVSGFGSITYCGEKLKTDGEVLLCRCGETKTPPFCDWSHIESGFSGKKSIESYKDIRVWEGKTIRTFFNANICMHASNCRQLGKLRKQELDESDSSAAEKIAKVVISCPSGALSYELIEGDNKITFEDSDHIEIVKGGEIQIKCKIDAENVNFLERQPENRLTLCRCGLSKNKPFCDGAHLAKKNFI